MAIKLKYSNFTDPAFGSGIAKLERHTGFDPRVAYNVSRVTSKIRTAQKEAQSQYTELIKEYAKKDDKGEFIPVKNAQGQGIPGTFDICEDKVEAHTKAVDDFAEKALTIERHRINLDDLKGVGLNPKEMTALEPLLSGLETVDEETSHDEGKKGT